MNISTRTVSSSRQLFRAISLLMILGLGEAPNLKADNFRPRIQKLHSHAPDPGGNYFGSGVAVSDQYLLVGEPADDSGPSASVFDAKTGRFLRRISPEDGATTDQFGDHVAVFGHLGLVGASHAARDPSNSNTGAAYLFDLRNGRQLFKLFAFDGASGDQFGISVAMNGELILIGANASANYTGAAYLFDLRTGALRAKLLSSAGAPSSYFGSEVALCGTRALIVSYRGGLQPNTGAVYVHDVTNPSATIYEDYKFSPAGIVPADGFGSSLAVSGRLALVGAFTDADAGTNAGAAYLFDWWTGTMLKKLTHTGAGFSRLFGADVAIDGKLGLVGERNFTGGPGAVYLFDLSAPANVTTEFAVLSPPDEDGSSSFGSKVSLCGNRAVASGSLDDDLGSSSGAAYLFSPLSRPFPMSSVAKVGDFAPGLVETDFRRFKGVGINPDGEISLCADLMGPGSNRNRDQGVWTTLQNNRALKPGLRSRQVVPDLFGLSLDGTVTRVNGAIGNSPNNTLFSVQANGGPLIKNRKVLLNYDGVMFSRIFSEGFNFFLGGPEPLGIQKIAEAVQFDATVTGVAYQLRKAAGQAPVTRSNDTGVTAFNELAAPLNIAAREGNAIVSAIFGGDSFGQMSGRIALAPQNVGGGEITFTGYRLPQAGGRALQQLYRTALVSDPLDIATQGDSAFSLSAGEIFSSFLGENMDTNAKALFRATVRGPGVTGANNEGIWHEVDGLVVRKGEAPDVNAPTEVFSRFLGFWSTSVGSVIWAKLRGRGVNARNDCAIYLYRSGQLYEILREGDATCECDGARIGTLQRVDVDPGSGNFTILASMTGATKSNQAYFAGDASLSPALSLPIPALVLRKGTRFNSQTSETTSIRSLSFDRTTDRAGTGSKGLSQVVNDSGEGVVTVRFENGAVEVMTGKL